MSREGVRYERALVLVESGGIPWGVFELPAPGGVLSADDVATEADARVAAGVWPPGAALSIDAPATPLRVVVPTCRNPQRVVRAVASLLRGPDPHLEIVVVENRPTGSTIAQVLAETFPDEPRVSCRDEHRPGLSRARNCGAEGVGPGLVGFLDDDIVAHPLWVPAMRAAASAPSPLPIGILAGRILPIGLENAAQLFFHRFTGFGENDLPATYRLDDPPAGNGLYPYAPGMFGSGASLCLPTDAFAALGGFDERLGTGTPSRGGEDLDIFVRALYARLAVRYVPQAVIWRRPSRLVGWAAVKGVLVRVRAVGDACQARRRGSRPVRVPASGAGRFSPFRRPGLHQERLEVGGLPTPPRADGSAGRGVGPRGVRKEPLAIAEGDGVMDAVRVGTADSSRATGRRP